MHTEGMIFLCRGGFEQVLLQELEERLSGDPSFQAGSGWVLLEGALTVEETARLEKPLVFERQRLPQAHWFPLESRESAIEGVLETFKGVWAGKTWGLHAFPANDQEGGAKAHALALEKELLKRLKSRFSEIHTQLVPEGQVPDQVMQLCRTEMGLWASFAPLKKLTSTAPGGVRRMPSDKKAPSRSYLKLEEALELLGKQPKAKERVVDLGAAPGGWSYAFLKRGCYVMAVDNGPMKINELDQLPGKLEHVRANGLTFSPPARSTDWMVGDMLITPGQALGLLRTWVSKGRMRRFVLNVKLPQKNPLVATKPLENYLDGIAGLTYQMRQLYHDRREVTVVGTLDS